MQYDIHQPTTCMYINSCNNDITISANFLFLFICYAKGCVQRGYIRSVLLTAYPGQQNSAGDIRRQRVNQGTLNKLALEHAERCVCVGNGVNWGHLPCEWRGLLAKRCMNLMLGPSTANYSIPEGVHPIE